MKTRKHFGYARLLEIIQPSPFRVEPKCPVARPCGGCQLQHCSYEKQLQWKQEKVANCLRRIGGHAVSRPAPHGRDCECEESDEGRNQRLSGDIYLHAAISAFGKNTEKSCTGLNNC